MPIKSKNESISWKQRTDKRMNDLFLNKYFIPIMRSKQEVNVLSMPAARWLWERSLIDFFPDNKFKFLGVERNPEIYSLAKSTAYQLNYQNKKRARFSMAKSVGQLGEAIKRADGTGIPEDSVFDIIYADYMGTWTRDKLDDIHAIYSNNYNCPRKSTFVMTLSLCTRNTVDFCNETVRFGQSIPDAQKVDIDDDHIHRRISKKTYSEDVFPLVQSIAAKVMAVGMEYGKLIKAHPPHIYYGPRGIFVNCLPQVSFCFTRLI